jgi:hypothetical protein
MESLMVSQAKDKEPVTMTAVLSMTKNMQSTISWEELSSLLPTMMMILLL